MRSWPSWRNSCRAHGSELCLHVRVGHCPSTYSPGLGQVSKIGTGCLEMSISFSSFHHSPICAWGMGTTLKAPGRHTMVQEVSPSLSLTLHSDRTLCFDFMAHGAPFRADPLGLPYWDWKPHLLIWDFDSDGGTSEETSGRCFHPTSNYASPSGLHQLDFPVYPSRRSIR